LAQCQVGDKLDGPEDPKQSAPKTSQGKRKLKLRNGRPVPQLDAETEAALIAAYADSCAGHSTDFVLCNPKVNAGFVKACKAQSIHGNAETWNRLLLRIRKAGKLPKPAPIIDRPPLDQVDPFNGAAEIAMQLISLDFQLTIDEILCSPKVAKQFDQLAEQFAPGFTPFEYRWAALSIRRRANRSKLRAAQNCVDWLHCELPAEKSLGEIDLADCERAGVYVLSSDQIDLYVGETNNFRQRVEQILELECWQDLGPSAVRFHPHDNRPSRQALQCVLIQRVSPLLNCTLLKANCDPNTTQRSLFPL